MYNDKDIFKVSQQILSDADCLFSSQEVDSALNKLAARINQQLKDQNPVILAVMNGGLIPCGMLLPKLDFPLQVDYIHATRYGENTSGGILNWIAKPTINLKNRTVLLVDDIHDEGTTLREIIKYCKEQEAQTVLSCVLVHKKHDRKTSPAADFTGLEVPDRYVFGYGMDYKTLLRNAEGIYAVKGM